MHYAYNINPCIVARNIHFTSIDLGRSIERFEDFCYLFKALFGSVICILNSRVVLKRIDIRVAPDIRPAGYPAFFDIWYPAGYPVSFAGYLVAA